MINAKKQQLSLLISALLGAQIAYALPQGGQVVHGTATISTPNSSTMNVTNSNNAVINWQQFNIGAGQTTNFIQPNSASSVLNRVISNNPSQILGNLNSNGQVFLINQHGILVGEGARVNTNGFFASTLNMTNEDFLNGNLNFSDGGLGDINNKGYIHAGEDGNVVLVAPNIENGGVVEVENGNVILAAGESITITSLDNSSVEFHVQAKENTVTNLGSVIAKNGAANLFAGTLKHTGSIRATGLVRDENGIIRLVALDKNEVSGAVDATGEVGGQIQILGDTVDIQSGALVDASGDNGGGEILIGGDQQGLNPDVQNATSTTIAEGSSVRADGGQTGDGGRVIVFASNDVHVHEKITAIGGSVNGDGGFIETSGLQELDITVVPDASAPNGDNGEWLIDPHNISIVASGGNDPADYSSGFVSGVDSTTLSASLISTALDNSIDVTISTGAGGSELGDISLDADITMSNSILGALTLNAHNDIIFNSNITANFGGSTDLTINAGNDIVFNQGSITTLGTSNFNATNNINVLDDFQFSGGGTFNFNAKTYVAPEAILIAGESYDNTEVIVNELDIEGLVELREDAVLEATSDLNLQYGGIIGGGIIDLSNGNDLILNGGFLMPYSGFALTMQDGDLIFNSGQLLISLDNSEVLIGASIDFLNNSTATINGGDLVLYWDNEISFLSSEFLSGDSANVMNCIGNITTCISGVNNGFDQIINPVNLSNGFGTSLSSAVANYTYNSSVSDSANTIVWDGGGDGVSWNDNLNWVGDISPAAVDAVYIGDSYSVDLAEAVSVDFIQIDGALNLITGADLNVETSGFLTNTAFGPDDGVMKITGFDAVLSGNGQFNSLPLTDVDFNSDASQTITRWNNFGTFKIADANLNIAGTNFNNFGFFSNEQTGADESVNVSSGSFNNYGILNLGGSGSIAVALSENTGLLSVLAGDVSLTADLNHTGSIYISDIGSLNLANGITVDFNDDGFSTSRDVKGLGGFEIQNGVVLNINYLTLFDDGITLTLDGGTIDLADTLSIGDSSINLMGGTLTTSNFTSFSTSAQSTLNISAATSDVIVNGIDLTTNGAVNFTSSDNDLLLTNGAVWTNSGTFDVLNTAHAAEIIDDDSASFALINLGVMNVAPTGDNETFFDISIENDGVINVNSGGFISLKDFQHSGDINIASGAEFALEGLNSNFSSATGQGVPAIYGPGEFLITTGATFDVSPFSMMISGATFTLDGGVMQGVNGTLDLDDSDIHLLSGSISGSEFSTASTSTLTLGDGFNSLTYNISGSLFESSTINWLGGNFSGTGDFAVGSATNNYFTSALLVDGLDITLEGNLNFTNSSINIGGGINPTNLTINANAIVSSSSTMSVLPLSQINLANATSLNQTVTVQGGVLNLAGSAAIDSLILNSGVINVDVNGNASSGDSLVIRDLIWNSGSIIGDNSANLTTTGDGTLIVGTLQDIDWNNSGTLTWTSGRNDVFTLNNATFQNDSSGVLNIIDFIEVESTHDVEQGKSFAGGTGTFVNDGIINLINSDLDLGGMTLLLGSSTSILNGSGNITGNVVNSDGFVSIGNPLNLVNAGNLTIDGDYIQGENGSLQIRIVDPVNGNFAYDTFNVNGNTSLDGELRISYFTNQVASITESFSPLNFSSAPTGSFSGFTDTNGNIVSIDFSNGNFTIVGTSSVDNVQLQDVLQSQEEFQEIIKTLKEDELDKSLAFIKNILKEDDEKDDEEKTESPKLVCR